MYLLFGYLKSQHVRGHFSFAEKVIFGTIVLTPMWWILGIQPLLYPAIAILLLARSFNFNHLIRKPLPICVWAWLAMSIVMLWTAMIGLVDASLGLKEWAAAIVSFLKGYFLIFTCLALPFWNTIRLEVLTRAISWLASSYLVTLCIQIVMLVAGYTKDFALPWTRFFPGNPLSFLIKAPTYQPFFGVVLPRTSLYTPDPPILGICGVLCFLICLGESNQVLRRTSLIGSLAALIVSQSRLGWICLPVALIITSVFRSRNTRQGALWSGSLTSLLCVCSGGLTFTEILNKPLEIFTNARPSSSTDREFVVRKTLVAWQESPWLGWGVSQETADWHTYSIPLGSFSTYAAVLYLHGVLGFAFFISTLLVMVLELGRLAIQGQEASQRALGAVIALYLFMEAIPLSWMVVYFWFFFIWVGCILSNSNKSKIHTIKA